MPEPASLETSGKYTDRVLFYFVQETADYGRQQEVADDQYSVYYRL